MFGIGKLVGPLAGQMGLLLKDAIAPDQRSAFIAILLATASKAGEKPNFNLQLEMNDLWTRLENLKAEAARAPAVGGLASRMVTSIQAINGPLLKALENVVQKSR